MCTDNVCKVGTAVSIPVDKVRAYKTAWDYDAREVSIPVDKVRASCLNVICVIRAIRTVSIPVDKVRA